MSGGTGGPAGAAGDAGTAQGEGGQGDGARFRTTPQRVLVNPARRMTASRVAVCVSMAAFPAACQGEPDGIEPGMPIELDASAIEVLGTSDVLAVVRDMEVLDNGSVWVLNEREPFFVGFGPGGEFLGAHGRAGGGPEDFRMPSGFLAGGWKGEAWVFDFARHAMIRVSEPDDLTEIPLRSESLPPGSVQGGMNMLAPSVRTASLGREIIVPRSSGTMREGPLQYRLALLRSDLVALDPETGGVRTLVSLGGVLEDPSGDFIPSEGAFPLWYRLWAVCGGNLVRVYDRVRNQLRGFDGSGTEVEQIDLPPVPFTEVSASQFARAVFGMRQAEVTGAVGVRLTAEDSARVLDQMVGMVRGQPHELASYLPRYVDLRCGDHGTMWMQPLGLDLGGLRGGRLWLRVAPDGGVREVRLPARFDALRFSASRVWGVYRDENDLPSVASVGLRDG